MQSKIETRKGLGKLGSALLSTLSAKGEEVFTVLEAAQVLGYGGGRMKKLLHDLARNKWIERIERGKYLILPLEAGPKAEHGTHPYIIARKLADPYYIGFASALNHYGITEQVSKTTYVVTTKPKRPLFFHSEEFRFVRLGGKRFFGVGEEWMGNLKFNISEVEKTVVDCLFMPEYSGGLTEVAKAFTKEFDYAKLYRYAVKMDDLAVLKRLGFILDAMNIKTSIKGRLLEKIRGGYCLLDTCGRRGGPKNDKWLVIENVEVVGRT